MVFQERRKTPIAPLIEGRGAQSKTRQRIPPGAAVELIIQLLVILDEQLPALIRVIDQERHGILNCVEKPPITGIVCLVLFGDDDQFVIGRYALFFRVKCPAGTFDDVHLVELEITEGADHSIDFPRNQRRG